MLDLTRADRLILRDYLSEQVEQDIDALKNPVTDHDMTQFYRGRIDFAEELLRDLPDKSGE